MWTCLFQWCKSFAKHFHLMYDLSLSLNASNVSIESPINLMSIFNTISVLHCSVSKIMCLKAVGYEGRPQKMKQLVFCNQHNREAISMQLRKCMKADSVV